MTDWRLPRRLSDDECEFVEDEEWEWVFEWDAVYHGSLQRTPGGRVPDPKDRPPTKRFIPWAAPGGECERTLARHAAPYIRHEMHSSLSRACALLMADRRCDARTRDLLREYLLGRE